MGAVPGQRAADRRRRLPHGAQALNALRLELRDSLDLVKAGDRAVAVPVGHRLPAVRAQREGLGVLAPPLHLAAPDHIAAARQRPRRRCARRPTTSCSTATRSAAARSVSTNRRAGQDLPVLGLDRGRRSSRSSASCSRPSATARPRTAASPRPRPHLDAHGGAHQPARRHRLPQDPARHRPHDRLPQRADEEQLAELFIRTVPCPAKRPERLPRRSGVPRRDEPPIDRKRLAAPARQRSPRARRAWCSAPQTTSWWWLGLIGWVPWLYAIEGLDPEEGVLVRLAHRHGHRVLGLHLADRAARQIRRLRPLAALFIHLLFAAFQGLQWALPACGDRQAARAPAATCSGSRRCAGSPARRCCRTCSRRYLALMWCYEPRWLQLAEIGGVTTIGSRSSDQRGLYVALLRGLSARRLNRPALAPLPRLADRHAALRHDPHGPGRRAHRRAPKVKVGVVQGNFGIYEWGHGATSGSSSGPAGRVGPPRARGRRADPVGRDRLPLLVHLPRRGATDLPRPPTPGPRDFTAPLIFGVVTAERRRGSAPTRGTPRWC
jgi:hypothetical protein